MIHLLHLPKTGGSALAEALWPYRLDYRIEIHGHRTTLADIPEQEVAIFSVRDPLSRFCSGFNSRLRQGRPRNDVPWSEREAAAFARFATPNDLAEGLCAADEDRRRQAEAAVEAIPHLAPLRQWIGSRAQVDARRDATHILAQASLDADFEALKLTLGLPAEATLPADPVRAHRTPPGFSTALSAPGRRAVMAFYRDDYPIYRYCLGLRRNALRRETLRRG